MTELRRRLFKIAPEKPGDDPGQHPETSERGPERVSQLLRRTREKHGQSLREVSANLRIRFAYLEAIEQGRFRELPGPTYAVGFVRSYSEYLGLDGGEIVRRFKGEVEGLDSKVPLSFPEPVPEGKVAGGAILLLSLIMLAVGYGGWYLLSRGEGIVGDLVPRLSQNLKALVAGGEPAPATAAAPVAATTPTAAAPAATGATPAPTVAADPGAVGGTQARGQEPAAALPPTTASSPSSLPASDPSSSSGVSATAAPVPATAAGEEDILGSAGESEEETALLTARSTPPIPAVPAAPAAPMTVPAGLGSPTIAGPLTVGDARVVLRARLASWIQISDANQVPLITRTLAAGEAYPVPDQPGLTLFTGNAGGLDIVVDGQVLPPLGAVGAVKRNIALDAGQLLARPQAP
jgi:hypothetical protein